MRITLAQLNPTIGDIEGNLDKIFTTLESTRQATTDLLVFPELFLTGYPPRDLLERPRFIERVQQALGSLTRRSTAYPGRGILVGAPLPTHAATGRGLFNAALLIYEGAIIARQYKTLLPTYDVFDEARYFDSAPGVCAVDFKGERLGISVCEDAWNDPRLWQRRNYRIDPIERLVEDGAGIIINIAASPFHLGKDRLRYRIMSTYAKRYGIPALLVNQVGGNDELVFDGRSLCVDGRGGVVAALPGFCEQVQTVDTAGQDTAAAYEPLEDIPSVHDALVLGVRDYMAKCGFRQAVLGLSGGIDSAVVCSLTVAAVGAGNVLGVAMPGPYSSPGSVDDARRLAGNLGIDFCVIPITDMFDAFLEALRKPFDGRPADLTEENLQARIRGTLLMGLSNKFGRLLLTTGNKSEVAVGYCTLYGDMCGGLAVIADVPKTMVYRLADHINRRGEIIPRSTIAKPPSAELRPDQRDQDSLPPYEVLDRILHHYIDEGCSLGELMDMDIAPDTVRAVIRMIDRSEYKRRQAAPGLKVTTKAFGMGRRMVIAARYEA
jgi:NAD+ synthase (glutamine-hydrolysing)